MKKMKIKANYIVYDYRDYPKRYRIQITHSGNQDNVLMDIERVILPSRIKKVTGCNICDIAPIDGHRMLDEPVLWRRVSRVSVSII